MKCKYIFIFLLLFFLLYPLTSYASSDLQLENLSYQVTLLENGDAIIVENWDISIEDTNTLFKTFERNASKYSGISDVSITETTNGMHKPFQEIYVEQYHVNKDCFYALNTDSSTFEIAWGVSEDDSSARRSFEIRYIVSDVIKNYDDCSEFYWQFIGNTSNIPAKQVTGSIYLPSAVTNSEDLKIWAHGPLNGVIEKTSNYTITFSVADLPAKTMLETRIVTPTSVFPTNFNTSSVKQLNSILEEEQLWAEQANQKRVILQIIVTIAILIFSSLLILLIIKIIKYYRLLKKIPPIKPTQKLEYFRDFPDETATPIEVDFIYHNHPSSISTYTLSACLLDLCRKGFLTFEVENGKKKDVVTVSLTDKETSSLNKAELICLQALEQVKEFYQKKKQKDTFSMEEFKNYFTRHTTEFKNLFTNLYKEAKEIACQKGKYDTTHEKEESKYATKRGLYFFLVFFLFPLAFMFISLFQASWLLLVLGILLTACFFIAGIFTLLLSNRYRQLTQKGVDEKEQLNALKNYLLHFSKIQEKDVPSLVLWEKYLVYATIFGIADKVLEQLKVVYPEMLDENYMLAHHYTYLYFMAHSPNTSLFSTINHSVVSTYGSIYSSGSGGGGGFSGGGGGGRRWRPEWVADRFLFAKEAKNSDLEFSPPFMLLLYKESLSTNYSIIFPIRSYPCTSVIWHITN